MVEAVVVVVVFGGFRPSTPEEEELTPEEDADPTEDTDTPDVLFG